MHFALFSLLLFACQQDKADTGGERCYQDLDQDGHGDPEVVVLGCGALASDDGDDCDDQDAAVHGDAPETCDGVDQDCDGEIDEDATDSPTWYTDADGDGYGDAGSTQAACDAPDGYVADATDCDDLDLTVHPGAAETCDQGDEDCDGEVDEEAIDLRAWYADADGDGYGDADTSLSVLACDAPDGTTDAPGDCDDSDPELHPEATDLCDGVDNDCDGETDEEPPTWYLDNDGDGYGVPGVTIAACDAPDASYVADATDCDDDDIATFPDAPETCDGVDNDCDDTDGWTEDNEDGVVSLYLYDTGAWTDLSEELGEGTSRAPITYDLTEDGELTFCDGTWYLYLWVGASEATVQSMNGSGSTTLSGADSSPVMYVSGSDGSSNVTLDGLTLTGGYGTYGAGLQIANGSEVYGHDLLITGNTATISGGGIYSGSSSLTLEASVISDNVSKEGGGLYIIDGQATLEDVTIDGNMAVALGGGISNRGETTLTCSDTSLGVTNNTAVRAGGGVYQRGNYDTPSSFSSSGCTWLDNEDEDLSWRDDGETDHDVVIGSEYGATPFICYASDAEDLYAGCYDASSL